MTDQLEMNPVSSGLREAYPAEVASWLKHNTGGMSPPPQLTTQISRLRSSRHGTDCARVQDGARWCKHLPKNVHKTIALQSLKDQTLQLFDIYSFATLSSFPDKSAPCLLLPELERSRCQRDLCKSHLQDAEGAFMLQLLQLLWPVTNPEGSKGLDQTGIYCNEIHILSLLYNI